MKLTERLEKIASLVDRGEWIADIGTDHGYIPSYLLENKIIDHAVLSDINQGPLENSMKEIERIDMLDKVEFRLGAGLKVIAPGEVGTAIIAGMGGILISDILEESKPVSRSLKKIILQPMQAPEVLRAYLCHNGYKIIAEHLVREDHRIYEIIEAVFSGDNVDNKEVYSDIEFEIPQKISEEYFDLRKDLVEKKIIESRSILDKIGGVENEATLRRKSEIEHRISVLESYL